MARTRHLPLYASIYVFARELYRIKTKLPKTLKYDLGQETFCSGMRMLKFVIVANQSQDKSLHLKRLLLEIELGWTLLRLLFDLRGLSEGEFKVFSERLSDIAKQAQSWLRWQQSHAGPPVARKNS